MTINIRAEASRVPDMDEVVKVADGGRLISNLTKALVHITNTTIDYINNNDVQTLSSQETSSSSQPLVTTTKYLTDIFTTPLPSTTITQNQSSVSSIAASSVLTTTTALQWLQHHPDTQLPATMKITDTAYAFLANLTYTNTNIFIPASAGPAIEDDEIRLEHAPQLSKSAMIKVYVLSIMALFSLLGNVLTMWNIYKTRLARRNSRHSWSAIYSLIFHLSIADVLVTGFCIIGEAAWCYTVKWLANDLTCKLVKLFQMFSLYLSTYVLVLIGVDRWIAVKYPMKSLNMAKRCYRLLGGTYILSLLLSLPQFFIFRVARGPFIEEFYQCVTHGFYTAEWQEQLYATFTLVMTFLLPLCILFVTYMSTFRTISSSEKMFQGSKLASYTNKPTGQTNRQRLIHKAKMKSLRISVVIIFAFLICWTPYNVMMLIFMFWNPDKRVGEDLQSAIFFFGMSNSLVNPLIYGAFHLCPMKRIASKKSNNNNGTYSLNRGDSQRTPSMLTAVTQVDGNGRQVRAYRQSSFYRSVSTTGSTYKENIGLLQSSTATPTTTTMAATPSALRKTASMKSPHPLQRTSLHAGGTRNSFKEMIQKKTTKYHNHSTEIIQNDNSVSSISCGSDDAGNDLKEVGVSIVLNHNNHRGGSGGGGGVVVGGAANLKKCSSTSINDGNPNDLHHQTILHAGGLQTLLSTMEDDISSV